MSKIKTGDTFTVNTFSGATIDCSRGTTYTAMDTITGIAACDGKQHDAIIFSDDMGDMVTAFIEKLTKA